KSEKVGSQATVPRHGRPGGMPSPGRFCVRGDVRAPSATEQAARGHSSWKPGKGRARPSCALRTARVSPEQHAIGYGTCLLDTGCGREKGVERTWEPRCASRASTSC